MLVLLACSPQNSQWNKEQYRKAAAALVEKQLYSEAVTMYENYLHSALIPKEDIPRVLFQIGNLEQDYLRNPQNALSRYTVLEALFPEENFNGELGKRMVQCLEALGRSSEASMTLQQQTQIDNKNVPIPSTQVVAELDGKKITIGDVEDAFGALPEAPLERAQAIRSYVAQILMAESAKRKGLNENDKVRRKINAIENQILAQATLQEEISIPEPSQMDLQTFYEAIKDRMTKGPDSSLSEEQKWKKVRHEWQILKQNEAIQAYTERLVQASQVKFFGAK